MGPEHSPASHSSSDSTSVRLAVASSAAAAAAAAAFGFFFKHTLLIVAFEPWPGRQCRPLRSLTSPPTVADTTRPVYCRPMYRLFLRKYSPFPAITFIAGLPRATTKPQEVLAGPAGQ
jgi:hypothetical protein